MPYLEDTGQEQERRVECSVCGIEDDVDGTHYLDSETFRWQCQYCNGINEISAPVEPDPDLEYELARESRQF